MKDNIKPVLNIVRYSNFVHKPERKMTVHVNCQTVSVDTL